MVGCLKSLWKVCFSQPFDGSWVDSWIVEVDGIFFRFLLVDWEKLRWERRVGGFF